MPDAGYDEIRLETLDETVVAYFAPTFEVQPQDVNDEFAQGRPDDRPAIVQNNGVWTSELVVQGEFVHSADMRPGHRDAVQDLFEQETVTPDDQIDRLRSYVVYNTPTAFRFFHRDREYTATSDGDVDIDDSVYPTVIPTELRVPEDGETSASRASFLVRMAIGVSRGGDEPTEPDT